MTTRSSTARATTPSELLDRTVHDLKNPLAVVRASLEWISQEISDRNDVLEAVRDASTATERLLVIVEDLELLVKLERGGPIGRERVELGGLLGRVSSSAGARLGDRGLTLACTAPFALETTGDAHLLTRSIEALIEGCVRGAPSGACLELEARAVAASVVDGVAVDAHVLIEVGLAGAVIDSAPPSAVNLDALANGGLGVYLAMKVAEAHGGSLLVRPTATVPRLRLTLPC